MSMAHVAPAIVLQADEPAWMLISGGESFSDSEYNYFVAWLDMPNDERHIICKLIVPLEVARRVRDQASREWVKGTH
jgi:hypothetical protein